jgi:PleD family two-component response regulator
MQLDIFSLEHLSQDEVMENFKVLELVPNRDFGSSDPYRHFIPKVFNLKDFDLAVDIPAIEDLRILVADDMIYNIQAIEMILGHAGIDVERQVHSVVDGEQAVIQIRANL